MPELPMLSESLFLHAAKCAFFLSGWKVDPLQAADNVSSPLLLCSARMAADADKHHVQPIKALADSSDTPFTARSSPVSGVVPPCGIPSPNLQVHAVVVLKAWRALNAFFFCFSFFVCFLVMPKVMLSDFVQRLISVAALMTPTAKRNVDKKPLKHI